MLWIDINFAFITFALALSSLIGGENGSTTMAPSHSAGILTPRKLTIISGLAIFLGALLLGKEVATTIGKKLTPPQILAQDKYTLVYYINSTFYLLLAVIFRVPIATTHMATLSVVSIGLYTGTLNTQKFFHILKWWFFTPTAAFLFGFLFEKFLYFRIVNFSSRFAVETIRKFLKIGVVATGAYFAFSAGTNNLANSMGIVIVRTPDFGSKVLALGAFFFGLGAIVLSPRILKAVGKKIVELGLLRASFLQIMEGTIILSASILGIPVSINETIVGGMIGIACARDGFKKTFSKSYLLQIAFFWFFIPWIALSTGLALCWIFNSFSK